MTLTLDEVNRIRFPMARRPNEGYRAGEVDDFVDNVVATFTSLNAETDRLKAQIEALKSDQGGGAPAADDGERARLADENDRLRGEVEALRNRAQGERGEGAGAPIDSTELDELRRVNAELQQRAERAEAELQQAREQAGAQQQFVGAGEDGQTAPQTEHIVVTTSAEASSSAIRLVSLATEQAERVITDAEQEAAAKTAEAERIAAETKAAAESDAEEIRTTAQSEADKLLADAKANADQVEVDARSRREELFSTLESEREEFAGKVDRLKSWESKYRSGIAEYLRGQVSALESDNFEPGDAPGLLGDERTASATPRLDALLADRQ